jgi:hypothetical protein
VQSQLSEAIALQERQPVLLAHPKSPPDTGPTPIFQAIDFLALFKLHTSRSRAPRGAPACWPVISDDTKMGATARRAKGCSVCNGTLAGADALSAFSFKTGTRREAWLRPP